MDLQNLSAVRASADEAKWVSTYAKNGKSKKRIKNVLRGPVQSACSCNKRTLGTRNFEQATGSHACDPTEVLESPELQDAPAALHSLLEFEQACSRCSSLERAEL